MPETAENCGGRIEDVVCEDRITALPDDLLLTILTEVPIKDAVATMILSKRWRFIWRMLPILVYEDNNDDKSKKSVWRFLDKSLQLNKAPVINTLSMELGPQCPTNADVGKCVAKAVDRGVLCLILELLWSADPTSMPKTFYSCESLMILYLSDKILVDVPSTACLPSLETLYLSGVVYKNEDSLVSFLSNCPVLEYLYVERKKDDNVKKFTVKVPSLLNLKYINFSSRNDVEENGRCLVIDTPALEEFHFIDCSGDSWSIENTPCLKKVSIYLVRSFPDIDKFLRSFSAVSILELALITDEMVTFSLICLSPFVITLLNLLMTICSTSQIMCCTTIRFSRLTMCKIRPVNSDWMDSLVPFLQNTPKLKFLIVDYVCILLSLKQLTMMKYV